ncbi:inosine-uridine preferring nucleoside hydrolase-like isoform x2 [Plakobranchus ocellatus]|uniref:Inosine-uridine preferring nucleoside hydrolase-like isoform x2 n=1 Tax=Plakobranchus ocellatus TaxID=259542 RepID=A0AAV3Z2L2_9GAST|nr:inosine-uridine preferring nucleoside hydrolase-like isoform x2 [Plakobranchus ocellatus]
MANLLEVGVEFESFDAFQAAMEQYEDKNFVQFSRIDSRSVEKAQETTPTKVYNPVIQFVQLTYACTFGPRKVASKSSGIRNSSSRKIDCPVRLRISSTPDGQRLVIRESKLDGHNHEVSEELYKSMARQKQLDEETELEIYNLISMHNDKRLARMLVRDRLTQEVGRSISIKDILNIEKKIGRRLEKEKSTSSDGVDKRESQEDGQPADLEADGRDGEENTEENEETAKDSDMPEEEEEEVHEDRDKQPEEQEEDKQQQQQEEKEEEEEGEEEKFVRKMKQGKDESEEDLNAEKRPPSKKPKSEMSSTSSSSVRRPQRHRREPSRFRDALMNGTKVLHTSQDKVVSILSPEEAEDMESEVTLTPSRKVKEEPGVRGRKRKIDGRSVPSSDGDGEAVEEYRRRKLAIQEELLDMEKKKMKILDEIVDKLNLIIENQSKS